MNRTEYPRPQFVRKNWLNLNGTWQFEFDDQQQGVTEKYLDHDSNLAMEISVPFVYQSELSQINDRGIHEYVWYKKSFDLPKGVQKQTYLHFGAVDYYAKVFVNGQYVGEHEGGHTSFKFEITSYLNELEQVVSVYVYDPHTDETIPRGKQFWEQESRGIWYTNSTGIWQTVWIEQVNFAHLEQIKFTPNVDTGMIQIDTTFSQSVLTTEQNYFLDYRISYGNQLIANDKIKVMELCEKRSVDLIKNKIFRTNFHDHGWLWSPDSPNLFDVTFEVVDAQGKVMDEVTSYFGFRKIHTENGMVYLNNQPFYQKLVLDQGYWPEGLLTAPRVNDFEKDIRLAKEMGFNGCRKHQKVEDPLFLHLADTLGFVVWGECASAPAFTEKSVTRLVKEWFEIVARDYNHPSIITWVPLNESWGVPDIHHDHKQQQFSETLYHLLHTIDDSRLVISNDGWEATVTDICAIHNYGHGALAETEKYNHFKETLSTVDNLVQQAHHRWNVYAQGYHHQGAPILLTEFGGIGFQVGEENGWGYTSVNNEERYLEDYGRIMQAVFASKALWGYCYTQLTDVEQEINGILTYDRQPKCDLAKIKERNQAFQPEKLVVENRT